MAQGGTSGHRLNPTALIEKVLRRVTARSDAADCRPTRHTSGWKEGAPSCMVQGLLVGFHRATQPSQAPAPSGRSCSPKARTVSNAPLPAMPMKKSAAS